MFRKMRRFKQELTREECIELLKNEPRGVLSVLGEDGYPYGIPMNHWYSERDGRLYFHGAKEGHKLDAIKKCDKASFCVLDKGSPIQGDWALSFRSVVVFGCIHTVTQQEKIAEICTGLCGKFTDDAEYPERELMRFGASVLCLELIPEHITGKLVKES